MEVTEFCVNLPWMFCNNVHKTLLLISFQVFNRSTCKITPTRNIQAVEYAIQQKNIDTVKPVAIN